MFKITGKLAPEAEPRPTLDVSIIRGRKIYFPLGYEEIYLDEFIQMIRAQIDDAQYAFDVHKKYIDRLKNVYKQTLTNLFYIHIVRSKIRVYFPSNINRKE